MDFEKRRILHVVDEKIIRYFVSVCEHLDISYTILGGTLLGAVRHKGFIPWDDDVDFGLPRPDYNKLVRYLIKNNSTKYEFKNFKNSEIKTYFSRIESKSISIIDQSAKKKDSRYAWIDIFPLDGMPNNKILRKIHQFNLLRIRMLLQYSQFSKIVNVNLTERPIFERVLIGLGKFIKPDRFLNTEYYNWKLDVCLQRYTFANSDYVVNFMGAYKFKEMFPKSFYENLIDYKFESLQLKAPQEANKILFQMYGANFMQPPSDMIKNKHFTKIIINDKDLVN